MVGFVGGTLGILAMTALGFGAVRLLGWPPIPALIVGMIVSTASTLVLVRLLLDRGELHARHGRVAVGITLVDDLAVVIFIFLIPSLGPWSPGASTPSGSPWPRPAPFSSRSDSSPRRCSPGSWPRSPGRRTGSCS